MPAIVVGFGCSLTMKSEVVVNRSISLFWVSSGYGVASRACHVVSTRPDQSVLPPVPAGRSKSQAEPSSYVTSSLVPSGEKVDRIWPPLVGSFGPSAIAGPLPSDASSASWTPSTWAVRRFAVSHFPSGD